MDISEINEMMPDFLGEANKTVHGYPTYICPKCGNGEGDNGSGIERYDKQDKIRWKCFKCGLLEDVPGLWMIHKDMVNYKDAVENLKKYYADAEGADAVEKKMGSVMEKAEKKKIEKPKKDYTIYYTVCKKHIAEIDYLAKRGLGQEIAEKYMLGYDPSYKSSSGDRWRALIIPTSRGSYIARNIDGDAKSRYEKHGETHIFNAKILWQEGKPIFVCEGEIDAMSVDEAGGDAIALGSTANFRKLVSVFEKKKPKRKLILALDNDDAGEKAAKDLRKELDRLGIENRQINVYGESKDANEALMADRDAFGDAIADAEQAWAAAAEKYEGRSDAGYLAGFLAEIEQEKDPCYVPTGYAELDKVLDGGVMEGLYIIAALSSLGKTAWTMQAACQMAQAGHDVLIISQEMSRKELMARNISRLTYLLAQERGLMPKHAKTARGIMMGSRYDSYADEEKKLIYDAADLYGGYAGRIHTIEGSDLTGAEKVRKLVQKHISITGHKPVVIVDYLQILAPIDVHASDKQNADRNISELKRISRDNHVPMVVISSINRKSYDKGIEMDALKESGGIEYGSDVVIGLQYAGIDDKNFNFDVAKQNVPRKIVLRVLKNRMGMVGNSINYDYYSPFNYFAETGLF